MTTDENRHNPDNFDGNNQPSRAERLDAPRTDQLLLSRGLSALLNREKSIQTVFDSLRDHARILEQELNPTKAEVERLTKERDADAKAIEALGRSFDAMREERNHLNTLLAAHEAAQPTAQASGKVDEWMREAARDVMNLNHPATPAVDNIAAIIAQHAPAPGGKAEEWMTQAADAILNSGEVKNLWPAGGTRWRVAAIIRQHAPAPDADRERLEKLADMVWETRWVSEDDDYQAMVGIAAEIRSGNFNGIDAARAKEDKP